MKKKNKSLATLLAVPVAFFCMGISFASCSHEHSYGSDLICTECGSALTLLDYEMTDGGYMVTGYEFCAGTDLEIPSECNGLPVVGIAYGAFAEEGFTSVMIPGSVVYIGDQAFYRCDDLKSVTTEDGVAYIGKQAFYACHTLESVEISSNIIGESAFANCTSLLNVTMDKNVTGIGDNAFEGCDSLESITIPDSVTSIGDYAFQGCESLESITIGSSVTSIGYSAFFYCASLTTVYYAGTEDEWNAISISSGNDYLTSATICCSGQW